MTRIPLADAQALARQLRRTRALRLALGALVLVGAVLVFALATWRREEPARLLPAGASAGVVVLDVSASISSDTYAQIERTLREAATSGERYGLVLFSDTAYEAFPPGTRAAALHGFRRFFRTHGRRNRRDSLTPWSAASRGGTRIPSGLRLARTILDRDRIEDGAVVLVSDLGEDASDIAPLSKTLIDYARSRTPLRVVGLSPAAGDKRFFEELLRSRGAVVDPPRRGAAAEDGRPRLARAGFPSELVAAGVLLLGLLALNELCCGRLTWGRERA